MFLSTWRIYSFTMERTTIEAIEAQIAAKYSKEVELMHLTMFLDGLWEYEHEQYEKQHHNKQKYTANCVWLCFEGQGPLIAAVPRNLFFGLFADPYPYVYTLHFSNKEIQNFKSLLTELHIFVFVLKLPKDTVVIFKKDGPCIVRKTLAKQVILCEDTIEYIDCVDCTITFP